MLLGDKLKLAMVKSRGRKMLPRWTWWIIVAFPALFFVVGVGFIIDSILFVSEAQSARGQVVEISRSYNDDGGISYTPTIRYRRSDGQIFEAETHIASSSYDYEIGGQVDILYAFDEPEVVRIDTFFSIYGLGLIFALVGIVFTTLLAFARIKIFPRFDSVLEQRERAAEEKWEQAANDARQTPPEPEPKATKPPDKYHPQKPKRKRSPTIRRIR